MAEGFLRLPSTDAELALWEAAKANDVMRLTSLLQAGASPNFSYGPVLKRN